MPITERLFVKEPPTREELQSLAACVEGGVRQLVATHSPHLRKLGLTGRQALALPEDEIIDLLIRQPMLLRKPILTDGEHIVIGTDRDAVLGLAGKHVMHS